MLTNIQTLHQHAGHSIAWFTIINELWNLSWSFLKSLAWSFNKQWPYREVLDNEISFSWKQFYFYWDDITIFQYSSLEELNQDKINWEKRFKKKNVITSETIDWKQVLEPSWYFEYNWEFYLLWLVYQDLNPDDNDENNWVYRWIIIDHSKYFKVNDTKNDISQRIAGTL